MTEYSWYHDPHVLKGMAGVAIAAFVLGGVVGYLLGVP